MDQLAIPQPDERAIQLRLSASAYVPLLSDADGSVTVSLARQIRVAGESILTGVVWSERFADVAEAKGRHAWMVSKSARLTEWGRLAVILGPDTLTAAIAKAWQADLDLIEKERRRQERDAREAETIWLIQDEVGRYKRPAIIMHLGNQRANPFLTIKVREGWEQDRIYDWARWQSDRYRDWKAHCDEHGAKSLEQLIMTEMLRTENAVKKAGLGSGGRRPLRFWRGDAK